MDCVGVDSFLLARRQRAQTYEGFRSAIVDVDGVGELG
jgi:hypothetical protein